MTARPLIIAHRGASSNAPENTIASFRAAVESRADGIEFDVRLAADGVPVVIHDATLKRTSGRNVRVGELTSAELGKMDVGSWFNTRRPKHAKAAFEKETVPTLTSVLALLADFQGLVYIELKCGLRSVGPLVDAVANLLGDSILLPRVIIKSFRLAALPEMRHYLPTVQTAALLEPSILNILRRRRYIIEMAREFGAQQLSLHRSLVTPKLARLACDADMPVTVWTVDAPKWITRCQHLGITALITNDPLRMLAARDGDR